MFHRSRIARIGAAAALTMCTATLLGYVSIDSNGNWPDDWPQALEPCRKLARTLDVATGTAETIYEIPFSKREEFERAWPHILAVKSEGAPLILVASPHTSAISEPMRSGVRVVGPPERVTYKSLVDGRAITPGPPWPKSAWLASGVLAEYVMLDEGGTWIPWESDHRRQMRARTDIMLVCDGKVVDLNRIALPPNTPVVDRRFEE